MHGTYHRRLHLTFNKHIRASSTEQILASLTGFQPISFFYSPLQPYVSFLLYLPPAVLLDPSSASACARKFADKSDLALLKHPSAVWANIQFDGFE